MKTIVKGMNIERHYVVKDCKRRMVHSSIDLIWSQTANSTRERLKPF